MRLREHALIQVFTFLVFGYFLGLPKAAVITLAHFIPTIDYIMAKLNVRKDLHRQLFHNVFVASGSGVILYLFFGTTAAIFGFLNILFHFALDLNGGNGVALLFPFSGKRFKFPS